METARKQKKELYASPVVSVYGTLKELTQMPGGHSDFEGASGKPHNKALPNPYPTPPPNH